MKQRMTSILATVLLTASSIGAGIISAMDSKIGWIILAIAAVFIIEMGAWAIRRIKEQSIKAERRFYNLDLSKGEEK